MLRKENNMSNQKFGFIGTVLLMTLLLSLAGGLAIAADRGPLTPEMAAKREVVRKQQSQRVTPEKRKAAAEALKAERIKIHKAKQEAQQLPPVNPNIK
jgi:hypothetical protein